MSEYKFIVYDKDYPLNFTIIGDNTSLTGRKVMTIRYEMFIKDIPDHRQIITKFEKFKRKECPGEYIFN